MSRWIPLESNPEVLNSWANKAGLDKKDSQFSDIYGFDDELLAMVPKPVKAVLLLFPITKNLEEKRHQEDKEIQAAQAANSDSQSSFKVKSSISGQSRSVIWFKQTISNACGTIGLLHALANTGVKFTESSPLVKFIGECQDKSPSERAHFLEVTPLFASIHAETASTGQSAIPTNLDTDLHFTCFIEAEVEGDVLPHVVELDGRRAGIFDRGKIQEEGGLLMEVAKLVKDTYMKSAAGSIQFSMTSLGPPAEW